MFDESIHGYKTGILGWKRPRSGAKGGSLEDGHLDSVAVPHLLQHVTEHSDKKQAGDFFFFFYFMYKS